MTDLNQVLFVGIGSPHGDDQIGWRVADELAALIFNSDRNSPFGNWLIRKAKSPVDLLDWLDGDTRTCVRRLILCDACQPGISQDVDVAAGAIHCWNWPHEEIQSVRFAGSHDMGLDEVLNLANALERLPPRIDIWGVEINGAEQAADLSSHLEHSAALIAWQICESMESARKTISWT